MNPDVKAIMASDETAAVVAGELICGPRGARVSLGRVKNGVFVPTNMGTAKMIELSVLPGAEEVIVTSEVAPDELVSGDPVDATVEDSKFELSLSDSIDVGEELGA